MALRIFAQKRKEMTGGYRKLHDYEFHNLCFSQGIIRLIKARRRCTGTVKIEEKTACKVLVGKRPF
jgi:hypothetical protein